MKKIIYICLLFHLAIFSQNLEKEKKKETKVKLADKQILRKGNDLYNQKRFVDAEAKYKKALYQNQNYQTAYYNLANTYYEQNKFEEALPGYDLVTKSTSDKTTKSESFHNMGNVFMKQKQYEKAISVYKNSLRINPKDDETRYNLALAQDLLKKQNKDQDKDNKDKKDNKDNQDQNKDQKDQNKDKKEDQGEDEEKDKDQNKGDDNKDQKDQNKDGDNEKKEKQQPKPNPNKLSQQQIQQLLEAMNNEENKTQKKVNAKKAQGRKVKQEKDW